MPRIAYKCKACLKELKKFYNSHSQVLKSLSCECGNGELVRQLSSPTQNSTMVIDNGVQAKQTELNRNIVDIVEDRQKADERSKGDAEIKRLI